MSTEDTSPSEAPQAEALEPTSRQRWRQLRQLVGLVLREAHRRSVSSTGAALAFVTVLTLVPLLAAFSSIGLRAFSQYEQQVLDVLMIILPYSEVALRQTLEDFVAQAQRVRGLGVLFFFLSSLVAFATVEAAIDRVWAAPARTLKARFLSFTLLLFWGPLLLGAALSSAIRLINIEPLGSLLTSSGVAVALPTVLLLVGLTMLYWLVPNAAVRFRWALTGGVVTTALLELLRRGFAIYVENFPSLGLVYGSFSLVLVFMISLNIAWNLVLLGNVLVFSLQNFDALSAGEAQRGRSLGPWLGLAAATLLAQSHRRGQPICSSTELSSRLRVLPRQLVDGVEPLVASGFLQQSSAPTDGYLLAYPAQELQVADLLACYDPTAADLDARDLSTTLEPLRRALLGTRDRELEQLSLDVLAHRDSPPAASGTASGAAAVAPGVAGSGSIPPDGEDLPTGVAPDAESDHRTAEAP
ncbi:MAG: YihY/virulence factor BrkB family protein [Acidobacteriota bacterium]